MDRIDYGFARRAVTVLDCLNRNEKAILKNLPIILKRNGILYCVSYLNAEEPRRTVLTSIKKNMRNEFEKLDTKELLCMTDANRYLLERKFAILLSWLKRLYAADTESLRVSEANHAPGALEGGDECPQ